MIAPLLFFIFFTSKSSLHFMLPDILSLFTSAFISATLFPAASEVLFGALVWQQPQYWQTWLLVASLGNTLGSVSSYVLGYFVPLRAQVVPRAQNWLQRCGAWALLLAWLPIVGDALPLVAGCLRLPFWRCVCLIAIGKTARYSAVLLGMWAI